MDLGDFRRKFNSALKANETITVFCRCSIKYTGRAEAELEEGDRLIIIKADNTILVHQPEGNNPINYMKPGTGMELLEADEGLLLKTQNSKLKETLDILITEVYNYATYRLEDGKKLVLVGNEKDMSNMIKAKPELISKDFKPLSREEHTTYGFIDVFGHDKKGNLVIVECKRYTAGVSAVQQLRRYVEKMMELKGLPKTKVKGVIAAPDIAKNAKEMLEKWNYTFISVNPPKRLEQYNKSQKSITEF